MIDEDFECALHGYLQKAELEYRAEYKPEGNVRGLVMGRKRE